MSFNLSHKGTETNKKIRININQLNLENFEEARNKRKKEKKNFATAEELTYSIEQSNRKRNSISSMSKKKRFSISEDTKGSLLEPMKEVN
jgi:hypothetical protein